MFTLLNLHEITRSGFGEVLKLHLSRYEEKSGIYWLHLTLGKTHAHTYAPIERLIGADFQGGLHVGKSSDLSTRVSKLFAALVDGTGRHHDLSVIYHRDEGIKARCPLDRLAISVHPCREESAAERLALEEYVAEFGEAPPWNVRCR